MKKLVIWTVLAFVAFSLTACASTGSTKVKCPSCGYEFEVPATS